MAPDNATQTTTDAQGQTSPDPGFVQPAQPPLAAQQQDPKGQQGQQWQYTPYAQYQSSYGVPYQPYQQAVNFNAQRFGGDGVTAGANLQPIAYGQPYEEKKSWGWAKFALYSVSVVFCICGLGLALAIIGHGESGWVPIAVSGGPLVLALVWSIAELITRCVRRFKAGIHPAAHVTLNLIIWLTAAVATGIESTSRAFDDEYAYDCNGYTSDGYGIDCESQYGGKDNLFSAAIAFTGLIWLVHFILFVGACVDTARRNAAWRTLIVGGGPVPWGPGGQGWQQMPQYNAAPQGEQGIPLQNRGTDAQAQGQGELRTEMGRNEMEQTPQTQLPAGQRVVTEYYTPGTAA